MEDNQIVKTFDIEYVSRADREKYINQNIVD